MSGKLGAVRIVRSGHWLYDNLVDKPVDIVALEYDWDYELCRAHDTDEEPTGPQPLGPDGCLYYVRFTHAGDPRTPTWVDSAGHPTVQGAAEAAEAKTPTPIRWLPPDPT